jgi:hypothetical protein
MRLGRRERGPPPDHPTAPSQPSRAPNDRSKDSEGPPEKSKGSYAWSQAGWTTSSFAYGDSSEPPRVAEQLGVFDRPRRERDQIPRDAFDESLTDDDYTNYAGQQEPTKSRLALENVGTREVDVYLVPTTKGHVCQYVVDPQEEPFAGSTGCTESLPDDVNWSASGSERTLEVEGIVADSVARVQVEVWGTRIDAAVGGNAFYLWTEVGRSCPQAVGAVVLHYRDGSSRVVRNEPLQSAAGDALTLPECG